MQEWKPLGEYNFKTDLNALPVQQADGRQLRENWITFRKRTLSLSHSQIEPTAWISLATYLVKPSGEVAVCLDLGPPNNIIRECHKPQIVEEIAQKLGGTVMCTKVDACKAFLQIYLTKKVSLLTIFNTHKG